MSFNRLKRKIGLIWLAIQFLLVAARIVVKTTRVSIFKTALVLSMLSLSTLEVLAAEVKQPVHVYFFTGGFIDVFSRETVKKIKTKTQNIGRDLEIPVKFERHWFTNWRPVSKKIQADRSKAKVVLLGHSWGAAGACLLYTSRCV